MEREETIMWMHKTALTIVTGFAATLLTASPHMTADAQDTVNIGMFTSLTGPSAIVGKDMQRGVELAINRVNEGYEVPLKDGSTRAIGPGVNGSQIRLIVEDSESRPQAAMDSVRKLVNVDNVSVVLGEYSSGLTLPTGQFINENGVVQISIGANSPKLRDVGPFFFDMIGLATLQGSAMVDLAEQAIGAKTFATFMPNNPYGVGVELAVCEAAKERGSECVATVRYEEQKTDYRAELQQANAPNPDAVIFFAYGAEAQLVLRQAYELGLNASEKWFGTEVSNWVNEVTDTPEIAEGVRGIEHDVGGDFYNEQYAGPYEEAYGEKPLTVFGGYGYDAAMIAALAIKEAGSTEPDKIREAVHKAAETYKGVTGDKAVDEEGMQTNEDYAILIYKDGGLQPYTP
ncbi:ABC transporter substrate-binding protein [Chelativorans xinjiangense]|uniref:ABC transporter substrate-binding protein n=1 Tax=Chelativorans xinjiangense TaxID=2681485 RepID=UPI00135B5916|nr:ABC transporter substrate-binding protein [Chelativorans xinjiangense]